MRILSKSSLAILCQIHYIKKVEGRVFGKKLDSSSARLKISNSQIPIYLLTNYIFFDLTLTTNKGKSIFNALPPHDLFTKNSVSLGF